MASYSLEKASDQYQTLRKDLLNQKILTLVALLSSSLVLILWLDMALKANVSTVSRTMLAIPPVANGMTWLLWGASRYVRALTGYRNVYDSKFKHLDSDEFERRDLYFDLQRAEYALRREQQTSLMIEVMVSLQFTMMAIISVLPLISTR